MCSPVSTETHLKILRLQSHSSRGGWSFNLRGNFEGIKSLKTTRTGYVLVSQEQSFTCKRAPLAMPHNTVVSSSREEPPLYWEFHKYFISKFISHSVYPSQIPPVYSFSFLPLFFKNFRNAAQDDLKLTIPLGLQVSTTPNLSHCFNFYLFYLWFIKNTEFSTIFL